MLGNESTLVTDCVRDVERKVVAPCFDRVMQKLYILRLGKMLCQIDVTGASSVERTSVRLAVEAKLIHRIACLILDDVEIGVVAIARNIESIATIPLGKLDSQIFCHSVAFMTNPILQGIFGLAGTVLL